MNFAIIVTESIFCVASPGSRAGGWQTFLSVAKAKSKRFFEPPILRAFAFCDGWAFEFLDGRVTLSLDARFVTAREKEKYKPRKRGTS
jgi:hypothetical protein